MDFSVLGGGVETMWTGSWAVPHGGDYRVFRALLCRLLEKTHSSRLLQDAMLACCSNQDWTLYAAFVVACLLGKWATHWVGTGLLSVIIGDLSITLTG